MKHILTFSIGILILCLSASAQDTGVDVEGFGEKKPVTFSGNIFSQAGFYQVSGIPDRTNNFIWSIGGSAAINLYETVSFPFSFTIGQYGNEFHRPTFSQFGISPRYKWITAHLGHRNMRLSNYTLNGHTFLGAGLELNPGKFRFAAMHGRLRGTAETQPNLISILPTFQRRGHGFKIGFGSEESFIDLIYFRGKDNDSSLSKPENSHILPAENLVVSLNSQVKIANPLIAYFEIAVSAFTRDQNSLGLSEKDSTSVARYLPPFLFKPNYSTRANMALRGGLRFSSQGFQLGLEYEQIDPEYETMGSFFFLNDIRQYTIQPSFGLFDHRIRVSGSFGLQENNLLGNRSETTRRFINNSSVVYSNPGKPFGAALNYTNFTLRQADGTVELTDSIRLSLVTTSINFTPYWNWMDSIRSRSLILSANYQILNDRNPFTREFTDMTTIFFTATYNQFFNHQGWGVQGGINYNQINVFNLDTDRYGVSAGLNKNMLDDRINTSFTANLNMVRVNNMRDGSVWSFNLSSGIAATQKLNFSLYLNSLINRSSLFDNYVEWMGGVQANYRFM